MEGEQEGWGGKGGGFRGQRMSPKDHRFVKDVGVDFDGRNHDVISFLAFSSLFLFLSLYFFDTVGDVEY